MPDRPPPERRANAIGINITRPKNRVGDTAKTTRALCATLRPRDRKTATEAATPYAIGEEAPGVANAPSKPAAKTDRENRENANASLAANKT